MKYRQLTKEQFENLHEEFARFLASQSIDKKEWEQLKKEKPHVAEDEMNVFSDVVWDDVLTKAKFVEHHSSTHLNLFKCNENTIDRIVITVSDKDLLKKEDWEWLLQHPLHDNVNYFYASKNYDIERNMEIFQLIEKGSILTQGSLYKMFNKLLKK